MGRSGDRFHRLYASVCLCYTNHRCPSRTNSHGVASRGSAGGCALYTGRLRQTLNNASFSEQAKQASILLPVLLSLEIRYNKPTSG